MEEGRGIIRTPGENTVGSRVSAVCAISFELFFSATQELINFSLFNPLLPQPRSAEVPLHRSHRYSLYVIYFSESAQEKQRGHQRQEKEGATDPDEIKETQVRESRSCYRLLVETWIHDINNLEDHRYASSQRSAATSRENSRVDIPNTSSVPALRVTLKARTVAAHMWS